MLSLLALSFEFINGFHDTANSIATSVSTRVLTPTIAIILTAVMNFVGALASDKVAYDHIERSRSRKCRSIRYCCGSDRGDHMESDHLVFRDPEQLFPCSDRRLGRVLHGIRNERSQGGLV